MSNNLLASLLIHPLAKDLDRRDINEQPSVNAPPSPPLVTVNPRPSQPPFREFRDARPAVYPTLGLKRPIDDVFTRFPVRKPIIAHAIFDHFPPSRLSTNVPETISFACFPAT